MAKLSAGIHAYVKDRWPRWLRRALPDANVRNSDLAREMLATPNRKREPRAVVSQWLHGARVPTATTVFFAGQALARASIPDGSEYVARPAMVPNLPSFIERPPYTGGLIALHAAGYYGDAMATALALLRSDDGEARAYAARFVSVVWIAHADLDGIDDATYSTERRAFTRRFIGDAPLHALDDAWNRRTKVDALGRALLAYCDVVGTEPSFAATQLGAVAAWRALVGTITLLSLDDDVLARQWQYGQTGFEDYWKRVIERQRVRHGSRPT